MLLSVLPSFDGFMKKKDVGERVNCVREETSLNSSFPPPAFLNSLLASLSYERVVPVALPID